MTNEELREEINQQINECNKILKRTQDRALKAYYQGQLYAFDLILRKVKD